MTARIARLKTEHIVYLVCNFLGLALVGSALRGLENTLKREERFFYDGRDIMTVIFPVVIVATGCFALVVSLAIQAFVDSYRRRDDRGLLTLGAIMAAWVIFGVVAGVSLRG